MRTRKPGRPKKVPTVQDRIAEVLIMLHQRMEELEARRDDIETQINNIQDTIDSLENIDLES